MTHHLQEVRRQMKTLGWKRGLTFRKRSTLKSERSEWSAFAVADAYMPDEPVGSSLSA
jgi:hypothetical protein